MENKINVEALNEKLLKFAGFMKATDTDGWFEPENQAYLSAKRYQVPDLVNDSNAQIKWIYPKLAANQVSISMAKSFGTISISDGKSCESHKCSYIWSISQGCIQPYLKIFTGSHLDSPTLSFALAVEKYIDNLKSEVRG